MKTMFTRFCSPFIASILAVSAIASLSATALEASPANQISISTKEITEAITVNDINIPAGAYAVTLSISDNSGFFASSYKMELSDGYVPVTDGIKVVTETEYLLNDSLALGVSNDNIVFISTAASTPINNDGSLLTFYVESDNANDDLNVALEETNFFMRSNSSRINNTRSGYYKIGDIDNDGYINAADATDVGVALNINNFNMIPVATANANLSYYFPNDPNMVCAQAADPISPDLDDPSQAQALANSKINTADANDILLYYDLASTGQINLYHSQSEGFCGRIMYYPY